MSGAKLMLWGLFKKVVIADRLALYVNMVYGDPYGSSGSTLALASYLFAFQIYCDFSGYSDIAIGAARMLGYDLMQNFNLPYFATSIADFWRRWHISLSTWFRDYLYIPLGGNRISAARWCTNILLVFVLSGAWHGASYTFLVWGLLHGLYYIGWRATAGFWTSLCNMLRIRGAVLRAIQMAVTFHLVVIAWVFFRANTLSDAWYVLSRIATGFHEPLYWGSSQFQTAISLMFVLTLIGVQTLQSFGIASLYSPSTRLPAYLRWPAYAGMIYAIAIFGVSSNAFIYFQF